jgi:hypothetical protein
MMRPEITSSFYTLVEKPTSWMFSVRLNEGEFRGVIYRYGKVSAALNPETLEPKISFQFQLDEVPAPHNKEELEQSISFKNLLGDVLTHILSNAFDTGHYKIGDNGRKSTNRNSAEANQ